MLKDGNEDSDIHCLRMGEGTAEEASEIALLTSELEGQTNQQSFRWLRWWWGEKGLETMN